ncbi:TonB-dependent siderophore receptor [Filimonas lacunae]|nr:TonB-dependent siderophore receptor [Filimonas lacunae]
MSALCQAGFAREGNLEKNGSISGSVTTSDHKPASDVSVTLLTTNKGAITNENGNFRISNIAPGTYTLQISLTGYTTVEREVVVEANKTTITSVQLEISQSELQQVTVKAARNPYVQRQLSSSLRLNEPVLEAAQNIQTVTAKTLADQQVISMSDGVLKNVSGATQQAIWGDMYTNVLMRGSQVTALRNGMSIATSYWSPLTEDMSVVDHIEFVKGPAGFVMPVGDPGGVYNVVTKKPTGVNRGEVSLMTGSYGLYRGALDLDGKLDKEGKLLYRFNIAGKKQNSFRDYEYNNRLTVAPVISYRMNATTVITAEYLLQKMKSSDIGGAYVFTTDGYGTLPRDFTILDPGIEPTHMTDQSFTVNLQKQLSTNWKFTAQAAYFNYKQQGTQLWAYNVAADSIVRNLCIWDASSNAKFFQAYLNGQIQTGSIQHRIIGGVDFNDKKYLADFWQSADLDADSAKFSLRNPQYGTFTNGYPVWDRTTPLAERAGPAGTQATTYYGFYLQDELGFFHNKLRLTLAGRYSYLKANYFADVSTDKKFTPRIGLSANMDANTTVYALYDQAFQPQPGIREDGQKVKPLTGSNIEAGVKRDWMNGKWNTSLSAYRIVRNDVNAKDPNDPNGVFIFQLGQTVSKGVEFDLRGEMLPGLNVIVNYAFTDSKITKTDTTEVSKATLNQPTGNYAKNVANAWLTYQVKTGILKGFGISGGITYQQGREQWDVSSTAPKLSLPDYTKIDGGLFWEHNAMRVTLNVYNIADKYLYIGSPSDYYYTYQAEAGRNWRLGVAYKF